MFIKRSIAQDILKAAQHFSALAVLGPRQSGKTTLVRNVFTNHAYVNLEHPKTRDFAVADPEGFFEQYQNEYGLIIDEFQHVPELLSYIQIFIDERKRPGYFILTGSQNFLMNEKISQTLAGRISIHTLLPLSIGELKEASLLPQSPEDLIWKGCYPSVYIDKELSSERWYQNYIQTYLERDVRQLKQVDDLQLFRTFVQLCAGRVGQLLNLASLGNDCGVSDTTARRWISLLEASYIIFLLQPYHKNFNKRITKSPKLYFVDTGLACSLLNIPEDSIADHYLRGGLFENMMIVDFYKRFYNQGSVPHLYFWRDQTHEIDLILDRGTSICPIEIKSGRTISQSFFSNVQYLAQLAALNPKDNAIIYTGDEHQKRSAGQVIGWRDIDLIGI
jgi:predicted AAA+ superfamily ATPase